MKKILISGLFILVAFSLSSQTRIKMKKEGGIYTIPCTVNGLKLRFIFDTGASNVCISLSEVAFMLKNEYMDERDIIGASSAQIADGSFVKNTQVILREIEIEGMKLYNVEATVMHNLSAPLLLGQSAIQRLGRIELDGDELVILKGKSTNSQENVTNFEKYLPLWKVMFEDEKEKWEVDLNSIERIGRNRIKCWTRVAFFSEELKALTLNGWEKIDFTLCLVVLDCEENEIATIDEIQYDKKGKKLNQFKYKYEDNRGSIVPESSGMLLKFFVCNQN
jgi:clan AA aspartic protease (TIGR02281 family)